MRLDESARKTAAEFWSHQPDRHIRRTRWWESPLVRTYVNRLLHPDATDAPGDGAIRWALDAVRARGLTLPRPRAISVGGGEGVKEALLIRAGLVDSVDVFELSADRAERGRQRAARDGLADRLHFQTADAFAADRASTYDIVHWNNALHHMLDVQAATEWSRHVLRDDGLFYMDDFVGPNRFQWAEPTLRWASMARQLLFEPYLKNPRRPDHRLSTTVRRVDPAQLAAADPTEAADSGRILPAIRRVFPAAEIKLTGGVVYLIALNDVLHNFDESDAADRALLHSLLRLDTVATRSMGIESLYAGSLAFKSDRAPRRSAIAWAHLQRRIETRVPDRSQLRAWYRVAIPATARQRIGALRRRLTRS